MNTNVAKLMGIVGTQTVQITLLQERVTELEGQLKEALEQVFKLQSDENQARKYLGSELPKEPLTASAS